MNSRTASRESVPGESHKAGRNDACPCGSGRKFKKCCGAAAATHEPAGPDPGLLLREGLRLHRQGDLAQAEAIYRKILAVQPDNPRALHLLGVIAHQAGRHDFAILLIRQAIALEPAAPEFHADLGNALESSGESQKALDAYARAISLNPGFSQAYHNLGVALRKLGRFEEAVKAYRSALALNPASFVTHTNLGVALLNLRKTTEAIACHREALKLRPDYAEAIGNLGTALAVDGQSAEAARYLENAIALNAGTAEIFNNLGTLRKEAGAVREAMDCYRKALALDSRNADAYSNLGVCLKEQGDMEQAIECYRRALDLNPACVDANSNLGSCLKARGETGEALQCYGRALAVDGNSAAAHMNLSLLLFMSGDLGAGWREYEWRWKANPKNAERPCKQPRWDGSSLEGKTIFIWAEQGLGDEFILASLIPEIARAAKHVVLECRPRLATLFARSFPAVEVVPFRDPFDPRTEAPDIDWQSPLGSLPRFLRPSLDSFPQHNQYLKADPARVDHWRRRIDSLGAGLNVGICWRSKLQTAARSPLYTSLDQWGSIFEIPGVHFINLQYDDCHAELDAARTRFGIEIHDWEDIDLMNDQDEVAALISGLDLVITAGTAVSALAGALSKPTWVFAVKTSGDWTTFGTGRVPWHPSMRLFERDYGEAWEPVLALIGAELSRLSSAQSG